MSSSDESKNKEHVSHHTQNHHPHNQDSTQNLKNNTSSNSRSKSKSRSPQDSTPESDPFFQDFYNRKKNRPRLSERIFNNRQPGGSVFDKDNFVDDFRKHIDEERKMFFDSDPFSNFPSHPRGGSPAPGGAHPAGSASPRMGRAGGGFPFESARSRLDDFPGARHPMFSTMRRPTWEDDPFAGNPFHRERHNSGSSGGASGSSSASTGEEHIIPIRIERGDGTSTQSNNATSNGPNAHAKAAAKANASVQRSNPISTTPIPMPPPPAEGMSMSPSPTPEPQIKMQHIPGPQRSSTDEVRKSPSPCPPASGERSPRAQSAPPESNDTTATSAGKKFVSSINIEPQVVNNKNKSSSIPQPTQFGGKCTKEKTPPRAGLGSDGRPIPIFVEGRGPVINNQHSNGQTRAPESQQQPKASRPAEPRDVTPPPKKPTQPKDQLEKVADITQDVKELDLKIDQFIGKTKDKEFLFLDEMLTRNLIKLDVIETEGREDVRNARKDCIKLIQGCIAKLESKIPENNKPSEQAMEVDASGESRPNSAMKTEPHPTAQAGGAAGDVPPSNSEAAACTSTETVKIAA